MRLAHIATIYAAIPSGNPAHSRTLKKTHRLSKQVMYHQRPQDPSSTVRPQFLFYGFRLEPRRHHNTSGVHGLAFSPLRSRFPPGRMELETTRHFMSSYQNSSAPRDPKTRVPVRHARDSGRRVLSASDCKKTASSGNFRGPRRQPHRPGEGTFPRDTNAQFSPRKIAHSGLLMRASRHLLELPL